MNVKVSNVNQPQWKEVNVRAKLPANLDKLQELAYNLWWVWNSEGKNLFRQIDNEAWHRAQSNPVMLLNTISYERMQELSNDQAFMEQLDKVYADFRRYMDAPRDKKKPSIAYCNSSGKSQSPAWGFPCDRRHLYSCCTASHIHRTSQPS